MYNPQHFNQNDAEHLKQFIVANPFASLITLNRLAAQNTLADSKPLSNQNVLNKSSTICVNHLPMLLTQTKGKEVLQGHIAKANDLWKTANTHSEVTLIFNGPNCYISPNYYPSKKVNGKAVPTWNYVAVHVTGKLSFVHDKAWNLAMLTTLVNTHEQHQAKPWSITDAPENYIDHMLQAIVGIEIDISSIVGKWKVSQNQTTENKQGICDGLVDALGDGLGEGLSLTPTKAQQSQLTLMSELVKNPLAY